MSLNQQKLHDLYDLIRQFAVRRKKGLLISVALLIVYALSLGLIFPWVLHSQIEKRGAEYLGRNLQLDSVRFNPFSFHLQIQSAQLEDLPENMNTESLTSFGLLSVNFDPLRSLFTLHWVFDELSLHGFSTNLIQQSDRRLNIADLFAPEQKAAAEEAAEAVEDRAPPKIIIDDLQLISASASFLNRALVEPHKLVFQNLGFSAQKIKLNAEDNNFQLGLESAGNGQVQLIGDFSLSPLTLNGQLKVDSENIVRLWPQITELFNFNIEQGLLSAEVNFHLHESAEKGLDFKMEDSRLGLEQLRLSDTAGEFVYQDALEIKGLGLLLGQQELDIGSLEIQGLQVSTRLEQAGLDIVQKLQPIVTESAGVDADKELPDQASGDTGEQTWRIQIDAVLLDDGEFRMQDALFAQTPVSWELSEIDLYLGPLSTDFSVATDISLALDVNQSGQLSVAGDLSPGPGELAFDVGMQDFDLSQLGPYLQQFARLELYSGGLDFKASVKMDTAVPEKLSGSSELSISGLRTTDQLINEDFIRWQKLAVDRIDFDLSEPEIRLNQVLLDGLYARIVLDQEGKTNLSDILSVKSAKDEDALDPATDSGSDPLDVQISEIRLQESSAFFADYSLVPQFATGIEEMSGSILDIAPESSAQVDISGKVDRYAPMLLQGRFDLLSETQSLDLELDFNDMQMSSLTPYSGTYAGYFIDSGLLSLGLDYSLEGSELEGTNSFKIQRLEFGEKTDSAKVTDLPLKLAIALLEDVNQEIALDLEVSGDVDSPKFNIGGLIGQAFRRVIGNIVTAPFAALGSLMKGAEDIDRINFEPGSSQLTEKQTKDLNKLSTAMVQRPLLKLKIMGNVEPAVDAQALSRLQLDMRLLQQATQPQTPISPSAIVENDGLARTVKMTYEDQFALDANDLFQQLRSSEGDTREPEPEIETRRRWYMALYNQLLEAETIKEEQLIQLAQDRADGVLAVIAGNQELDVTRLSVRDSSVYMGRAGHMVSLELDAE